jgi:hypothetical protein
VNGKLTGGLEIGYIYIEREREGEREWRLRKMEGIWEATRRYDQCK